MSHRELDRLDAIPFESEHQFMATLHRGKDGHIIYKKGAVERVVGRCSTMGDDLATSYRLSRKKSSPPRTGWRQMVFGSWRSPNEKPQPGNASSTITMWRAT